MKYLFIALLPTLGFSATWNLEKGSAEYEVRHLIKTVTSESKEVKGKIECKKELCEFLVAVPVKSFVSSDANRDLNMQQTTEAGKYPLTTARGNLPEKILKDSGTFKVPVVVDFHGKKESYSATVKSQGEGKINSSIVIDLDKHSIEKPSLFGVSINKEVPVTFELQFKKSK